MSKNLLFALVIIAIGGGIYFFSGGGAEKAPSPEKEQSTAEEITPGAISETPQEEVPQKIDPEPGAIYHEIALSPQNDSGQGGAVIFDEQEGELLVTLTFFSYPTEVTQPAHIHEGSCEDLGSIKYPLVSPIGGGSTETTLDMTLADLLAEAPWAVNIHKSTDESGVSVSCGDF
jgi:hypothetical protein